MRGRPQEVMRNGWVYWGFSCGGRFPKEVGNYLTPPGQSGTTGSG